MINIVITKQTALTVTGHRPSKLNGYNRYDNTNLIKVISTAIEDFISKGYDTFIGGMALGVDMWFGQEVVNLRDTKYPHIKFIAAIPCKNQFSVWKNQRSIEEWHELVERADSSYYITDTDYTPSCMEIRNRWMVDNASHVLAVWDGTAGGTYNCIKYAEERGLPITRINPMDFKG